MRLCSSRLCPSTTKRTTLQNPVSVAIEADQSAFQFYKSGVFSAACGTNLDHGVLIVGYGTDGGKNYWKVKNSWGETWGEGGYIKMAKDTSAKSGQCGIAMQPSYPKAGGPSPPSPPSPPTPPSPPSPPTPPSPPSGECTIPTALECAKGIGSCIAECKTGIPACISCLGPEFQTCCPCIKKLDPSFPISCGAGPSPPSPPSPSGKTHYGDPTKGCEADEQAVQVQGVTGAFCSPDCTSSACPTDVPSGVTAAPQCALKSTTGAKKCALICSATTDEASLRAGDAMCGEATCQPIQGTGICTYGASYDLEGSAPEFVSLM